MDRKINIDKNRIFPVYVFLSVFLLVLFKMHSLDVWFHIHAGEWIWKNHAIPKVDSFSLLSNRGKWVYHEWIPAILFFLLWKAGGPVLFVIIKAAWVGIIHLIGYGIAKIRGAKPELAAFFILLGCMGARFRLNERPHLFFFMFLLIILYLLEKGRRGETKALIWLIPAQILWTNSHGSFLIGPIIVLSAFIATKLQKDFLDTKGWRSGEDIPSPSWKPWLFTFTGVSLATLLNPYGIELLKYPFHVENLEATRTYITEWKRSTWNDLYSIPGLYLIAVLISAILLAKRKIFRLYDAVILLLFFTLALRAARFHAIWSITTSPILATWLSILLKDTRLPFSVEAKRFQGKIKRFQKFILPSIMAAMTALTVWLNDSFKPGVGINEILYPAGAAKFISSLKSEGNVANPYNWGSYLIGKLPDERKVLVDGRIEIYDQRQIVDLFKNGWSPQSWKPYIQKNNINILATFRKEGRQPFETNILRADDWTLVYWDDMSEVWLRSVPETLEEREMYRFKFLPAPELLQNTTLSDENSCNELKRVVQMSQLHFHASNFLARCLANRGPEYYAEAEKYMRMAVGLQPKDAGAANDLAILCQNQGKIEEAEKYYTSALSLKDDYPEAAYNLGNLLWQIGRKKDAARIYKQFIKYARPEWKSQIESSRQRILTE